MRGGSFASTKALASAHHCRQCRCVVEPIDLGPTGGCLWSDPEEWARRRTPEGCIVCVSGGPLDIVAEFASCWATMPRTAPLPAYVCVISRVHVNEPFEMSDTEQANFWRDTMAIARAVARQAQPIKMNYEIHGNTIPHLHMHLFPRTAGDVYVGYVIHHRVEFEHSAEDLEELKTGIVARLREAERLA